MWRFRGTDVAAARALVEAAFDAGVTLFDTADIYGPDNDEDFGAAEALLGRVFAGAGVHARSAVGVSVLPLNSPVEVELIVEFG